MLQEGAARQHIKRVCYTYYGGVLWGRTMLFHADGIVVALSCCCMCSTDGARSVFAVLLGQLRANCVIDISY